jgi:hypothetical protein
VELSYNSGGKTEKGIYRRGRSDCGNIEQGGDGMVAGTVTAGNGRAKEIIIKRRGRADQTFTVIYNRGILKTVASQILQWGNIDGKDGCVYSVECDDTEVLAKAKYVFNRYAEVPIAGWYEAHEDGRAYSKRHRIKIQSRDMD